MVKKTFLWNFKGKIFPMEHTITKELFYKTYVRDIIEEDENIKILDTGSRIFNFYYNPKREPIFGFFKIKKKKNQWKSYKYKKLFKRIIGSKVPKKYDKLTIGASINLEYRILRHKHWNDLQLEVPVVPNAKGSDVAKFSRTAAKFTVKNDTKKQKFLPVEILGAKKGGFNVRFSIIKGFLPNDQYIRSERAVEKKRRKFLFLNKNTSSVFKRNLFWKSNIDKGVKRLPLKLQNFRFTTTISKKRFVKKRRLGTRRKFSYLRKVWKKRPFIFKNKRINPIQYPKKNQMKVLSRVIFTYQKLPKKSKNLNKN